MQKATAMGLDSYTLGLIGCLALLVLVIGGVRVYLAAALVGLIGCVAIIGWGPGAGLVGTIPHSKSVNYTLSVLPMFILIGYLAFYAGMTQSLFEAAKAWMGWMPGGLAIATIFAVAAFSAVSGASTAAAAVFARVAIPEMLKANYDKRLAAGVVAAGGTLDALIPPSAIMVVYAIIVEASIGKLLIAGFIPGFISAVCYAGIVVIWSIINPKVGAPIRGYTWQQRISSLPGTLPVIGVIVIIFSAMFLGWATPTEAGALGAFVVLVVAILNRMKIAQLNEALLETAKLTVMIFAIIWGILIFVRFLGFAGLPEAFSQWVVDLPVPPVVIIIGMLMVYLVLGMFMDAIGMMLLTLPVFYPAVVALGYDPIWFGIIVVKMAGVCLVTPPIGLNCFVVGAVRRDIPLTTVFQGALPFVIADFIAISLFVAFPEIVTFLPDLMLN
ncbi:MAG TPA: TRAP transporter large permease [Hyphomicrobiaceae bacterium]|nr:TRAP transporter large permease [Hyphomicrobiaceae bacterium]